MTFRRSKIIATVGPACSREEDILALASAGVNVFRLNFSHGDQKEKEEWVRKIRAVAARHGTVVSILGDLQGPKIRTGRMADNGQSLSSGQAITVTTRNILGRDGIIPITYQGLPRDVEKGDRILLDDGLLEMVVEEIAGPDIRGRMVTGGLLRNHKGMNLPGVRVSAPPLTGKDRRDVEFCVRHQLDFVALSFVRKSGDVRELKKILAALDSDVPVIAKIEKPEAVADFDSILDAADGIMLARGDLGVEMSPEKVPLIQKNLIRKSNLAGKPVITATQMLESMIRNPRPTRAETSDVANAILDGTDAIMLSGETAVGSYPVEAVMVMDRVSVDVEQAIGLTGAAYRPLSGLDQKRRLPEAIGQAACRVAADVGAAAVLAFTQTGRTAALVAKYRPAVPIVAVTPSAQIQRRLNLYAGVISLPVHLTGATDTQIRSVEKAVLEAGVLRPGAVVVITMGSPVGVPGSTNLLKVHRLAAGAAD